MKKAFFVSNILLIAAILVGDLCYTLWGGLWLKGITSFGFVLLGIVNLLFSIRTKGKGEGRGLSLRFPIAMVLGLTFSMLGDIFLNLHFITGALIFALGHIAYFASYCFFEKYRRTDIIPSGLLFAISAAVILLVPAFDFGSPVMQAVCLGYALVISLMLGKAVANQIRHRNRITLAIALGSLLFYFSDFMLLLQKFAHAPRITGTLCLATYYPAQILLAVSVLLYAVSFGAIPGDGNSRK